MFRELEQMACSSMQEKYGYENSRFQKDVDENFHCSVCHNVLKKPRMCQNNEHVFCHACITEHLRRNSQTCPECSEHLTVDTLRRPRVLNNYLSKLKINCDFASRGCPEFVCVENLESHVANCGFAPVMCPNQNCGMVIDKQDRVHHETVVCEYKKTKEHDSKQALKCDLMELDKNVKAENVNTCNNHVEIKNVAGNLKECLVELDEKIGSVEKTLENNQTEMKKMVGKFEESFVGMNKIINQKLEDLNSCKDVLKEDQCEVKKELKDVKVNLSKVNNNVEELRAMMGQMLEKFSKLELTKKPPSPTEEVLTTTRKDILIAGGGNSAEVFSWDTNSWYEIESLNEAHSGASSFVLNEQVFDVGGEITKTIETLDLNELPLKWKKFSAELPYESCDHRTVVIESRVIHLGGYNCDEGKRSNAVSELQVTSPYRMKELCQMPKSADCHGAEAFEDKALIMGGEDDNGAALDSVFEFDPEKNECKEMPLLPNPLKEMATVRWGDQVVVLGGRSKDNEVLDDVFMYDGKTGETTTLPSMLKKRYNCCAIGTEDVIVVMGGVDEKYERVCLVECLTIGAASWKYLSPMSSNRYRAVAEVLPSTRKYV